MAANASMSEPFSMTQTEPEKRRAIVRATIELVAERGFHATPMSMIAARAGVGAGSIYRYFADKEILIHETFAEVSARTHEAMLDSYPRDASIRRRYEHFFLRMSHFFIEHPSDFGFLRQYFDSPFGIALRRDKMMEQECRGRDDESLSCLIEEGIASGLFKKLPPLVHISIIFGGLVAVAREHILGFVTLDTPMLQIIADACWDALARH
ncbi:MAG TPA: TetR family transcriptional regulator [Desulfobulbaceae bacterium]|nr:TetR family transcriptional regulator [Desulfobulbaceae bacterium]